MTYPSGAGKMDGMIYGGTNFGATIHRNAPPWLIKRWAAASKDWQNRYGQAGTNVTATCPGGAPVEFATETRDGKRRFRWLCREPVGKSPTQVWDREKARWDARQLYCPATRGYGMTTKTACSTDRPKGALKKIATAAVAPALVPAALVAKKTFQLITRPLRKNINKLKARRALKLAWDRRKSNVPNAVDRKDARNWAKSKLKAKGPHGHLLALLAGPPDTAMAELGMTTLGVTGAEEAAILAAIPILVSLLNKMMDGFIKSGEIKAVVQAGGEAYVGQQTQEWQAEQAAEQQFEQESEYEDTMAGALGEMSTGDKWGLGLLITMGAAVAGLGVYAIARGHRLDLPYLR